MRLAFHPSTITSLTDIEHAVAQTSDADLRDKDFLALRFDASSWLSLCRAEATAIETLGAQRDLVTRRAPRLTLIALPEMAHCSSGAPFDLASTVWVPKRLFPKAGNALHEDLAPDELKALRNLDLARLIRAAQERCVLRASAKHHFALPSRAHSTQFVRVAEALTDMRTIDTIAYWISLDTLSIAQQGERPICLVVDHPSMLVLGARISALSPISVGVKALETYPTTGETIRETFRRLTELRSDYRQIYILVSFSATGGLVKLIKEWISDLDSVQVLYAADKRGNSMCLPDLYGYEIYGSGECKLCQAGSIPVPISESTYFVADQKFETVAIPPKFFVQQREFLAKYGRVPGVLRTHYDDPNEGMPRHHAYYIDARTLLENAEFSEEFRRKLLEINPKPELILVPGHPVATQLATIAQATLGCRSFVLEPQNGLDEDAIHAIQRCRSILIIDDLMITGSRLIEFNNFFREEQSVFFGVETINFLTLLATPSSSRAYDEVKRGLTSAHSWEAKLQHLYTVVLPSWHQGKDCPWCVEEGILSRLVEGEDLLESALNSRLVALANRAGGLTDQCFELPSGTGSVPIFGQQSPILPAGSTGLQIAFACASAVQQLRNDPDKPLNSSAFPIPSLLAKRVFASNYTERLVWIGLLRSLKASELSEELGSYITNDLARAVDNPRDRFVVRELVIAGLSGKFGQLYDDPSLAKAFSCADISLDAAKAAHYVLARAHAGASPSEARPFPRNLRQNKILEWLLRQWRALFNS